MKFLIRILKALYNFFYAKLFGHKLRLVKYKSKLYIDCANFLLKRGFTQTGDYCFVKDYNGQYVNTYFFLYHIYSDGLTLNTYFPKQDFVIIKNTDDIQNQINLAIKHNKKYNERYKTISNPN